jgi:hypothetical protein
MLGRRGTMDLPVRLMVVALIICISLPLLTSAIERGGSDNAALSMNSEADKIFNAVAAVHYSGIGSSRTVTINIPDGSEMVIPGGDGSDGYSIKMIFKGRNVGVRYMDSPPIRFVTECLTMTHSVLLLITSDVIDGNNAVRVNVI